MARRANSIQNPISNPSLYQNPTNFLTNEHSKKIIGKKSDAIARELAGVHGSINDALDNIKNATESINQRKNDKL